MTTTVWIFVIGLTLLVIGIIFICLFVKKDKTKDKEVKNKVNRLNTLMQVNLPSSESSCLPTDSEYTPGSEGQIKYSAFIKALEDIQTAATELDTFLTQNQYKITEELYNSAVEEVKKAKEITMENLSKNFKSCSDWCTGYKENPNTTRWFPDQYKCMCNRGYGKEILAGDYAYCSPYTEEPVQVQGLIDDISKMDLSLQIKKPDVIQYTPFGVGGLIPNEAVTKFVKNTQVVAGLKSVLISGSFCAIVDEANHVHGITTQAELTLPPKIYFISDRKVYRIKNAKWFASPGPIDRTLIPGTIQGGTVTIENTPSWIGVNECYSNIFQDTTP